VKGEDATVAALLFLGLFMPLLFIYFIIYLIVFLVSWLVGWLQVLRAFLGEGGLSERVG